MDVLVSDLVDWLEDDFAALLLAAEIARLAESWAALTESLAADWTCANSDAFLSNACCNDDAVVEFSSADFSALTYVSPLLAALFSRSTPSLVSKTRW